MPSSGFWRPATDFNPETTDAIIGGFSFFDAGGILVSRRKLCYNFPILC